MTNEEKEEAVITTPTTEQVQQATNVVTVIKCAPSRNLNVGFPHFPTAKELHEHLQEIAKPVRRTFFLYLSYFLIYIFILILSTLISVNRYFVVVIIVDL